MSSTQMAWILLYVWVAPMAASSEPALHALFGLLLLLHVVIGEYRDYLKRKLDKMLSTTADSKKGGK